MVRGRDRLACKTTWRSSRARTERAALHAIRPLPSAADGRTEEENLERPPRQAPGHAQGRQGAPEQLPALPQPAAAAPGLPDLRYLRRPRGHLPRGRRRRRPPPTTPSSRGARARRDRRPRWLRSRAGFDVLAEGARIAAADGIAVRIFGPSACAWPRRGRGDRGRPDRRVDRQRRGSGRRGAGQEGGLGRAGRRATSPRGAAAAMVSLARPGRRWRRRPSASPAAGRAAAGAGGSGSGARQTGPLPRRRRQRRGSRRTPGPVRLPRRRLSDTVLGVDEPHGGPAHGRRGAGRAAARWSRRTGCSAAPRESPSPATSRAGPAGGEGRRRRHDGFTGNVALKLLEGTARGGRRRRRRRRPLQSGLGARRAAAQPALGGLRRELHPDTTGGAVCWACAPSRWSATAARGPRESPTRGTGGALRRGPGGRGDRGPAPRRGRRPRRPRRPPVARDRKAR